MSKQTCPEQGEHWITDKSGQHMYKCPKCGGAKGHWISDNGWTATWKPCKAGSGFVTDSGTGEEPVYNMDEVDLCAKCGTMKHLNQYGVCGRCYPTLPVMDSAPQPSEAEGKPVPAPNPPIPDELGNVLDVFAMDRDGGVDYDEAKGYAIKAITRLYAGREIEARLDEVVWYSNHVGILHEPWDKYEVKRKQALKLAKEKLL